MKKIPLSRGKFALVDDCDYKYLSQWKWYAHRAHDIFYAYRHTNKQDPEKTRYIKMHNVVLQRMGIRLLNNQVDHIDRDSLNNQRKNLRVATNHENQYNRIKYKNNTSGYKGVFWCKTYQKWLAQIRANGKQICLGYHHNIQDAIIAYNTAAIKYHGKFARLNNVPH